MTYIQDELRRAREIKNLSQAELGARVGQPQSAISRIERGGDLRLSTLLELARALELEPVLVPRQWIPAVRSIVRQAGNAAGSVSETRLVGGEAEDATEDFENRN